ncbi:MAG: PIG-L deacetylase family protein [Chloroflexota bacterium]
MSSYSPYIPKSFMAVFAHPDDIEFSCAGTLAKWVQAGARGAYVLVTSGDVGIAEAGMTKERASDIREAEATAAANAIGVTDVTYFRVGDSMVENNLALRKRIVREIRRFQPEVIVSGDPTIVFNPGGGINHPDHRAVGMAAVDAVYPSTGQPNLFEELGEEGLVAHKVRKMYVVSYTHGETLVDISDTLELKLEALLKHESQVGHIEGLADRMRQRAEQIGAGVDGVRYAERFRVVTVENDEKWAKLQEKAPEQYTR